MRREISERNSTMDQEGQTVRESEHGAISCITWELEHDPHKLPDLPPLPLLIPGTHAKNIHLIKIAALEHDIVGLTNHGHVLRIYLQEGDISRPLTWEYASLITLCTSYTSERPVVALIF